ncbi:hypothetical protein BCV72DRAFT_320049 [Rhizopus microsporus var. microsporus]|uniref:Uncharacterized protein n=1 Tax=Rhizopus microsporus var. microsporus TaxID=86635 RepID=A0A1X0QQ34_RHIZD|nr:hypothetical protein BCV72DRAFT_320049 [Rhizopus microsporus var. microsporus]
MSDNNSSNCCKELPVDSRKTLAYFIYKQKQVSIMENVPSKVASKAHVYGKLRELPFTGILSKKKFNSLREETLQSINSNKTFAPGKKKLAKLTPQQVSVVQNFIDTVKTRVQDGTFTPAKYTDKRGCRFFSIAPIYSVQTKSIQIDAQAFWRLVKQCGIPNYPKGKKTESDLTDFYYHLFNFTKLGFRTRDSLTSGKKFRSLATTKKPSDFIDGIRNDYDIWGVDPGVSTILIAGNNLDEYYHLCCYNDANFIRKKHQEQHTAQFLKISNLRSLKTSNITELSLYDDITTKFCRSSKLKFQCYIRKQKGMHEICKRLMHGSVKYNKKASTGVKTSSAENESKYCLPAPLDHPDKPRKTIIAFGDCMGTCPPYKKALQKYCGNQLEICMVDEYLTCQICNRCKNRNMGNVVTEKSKRRNRDIMAAHNILDIFLFAAKNNNQRLEVFMRQGISNG